MTPVDGFQEAEIFEHDGVRLPVYVSTGGEKPLVVLHELPGMMPSFIEFCRRISDDGFRVYMPLLFKSPGTEMGGAQIARFCMSREFFKLFMVRNGASGGLPVVNWLRGLLSHVGSREPDRNIGVIGMCLTGNFALAGIADPKVSAAIACQPAFPVMFGLKGLAMSERQRWEAVARAKSLPPPCVKGYRYERDWRSRRGHIDAIRDAFGDAFEMFPELPGAHHSTLTADSASEEAYRDVVSFLNARL